MKIVLMDKYYIFIDILRNVISKKIFKKNLLWYHSRLYYTFSISNEHIIFFIPNKNVTNHENRFHQSGPYL